MPNETNNPEVNLAGKPSDDFMKAIANAFEGTPAGGKPVDPADYAPKPKLQNSPTYQPQAQPQPQPPARKIYDSPLPAAGMRHGGKLPVHLVPPEYNLLLSAILEYGAQKYSDHNFEKGMDFDDLLRGAESHLMAMKAGVIYDPESGLPHAGHAAWNMLTFAMQMMREPASEEVFTQVIATRRAGNLAQVTREYAEKHALDPTLPPIEFAAVPWHQRVAALRSLTQQPPK